MRDRKLKTIFLVSRNFPEKADSVIVLGFECTIHTKFKTKSLEPFLINSKFKIFFLCELSLILGVARKRKEQAEDIYKGTPDIEFEQDWPVGLCVILADGQKIKNYFSSFKDFFGKSR